MTSPPASLLVNAHLIDYLAYYLKLESPRFAVLVTGEWGTGKTHLLSRLLPWTGENPQAYYVSLFGLKSAEEITGALYAEMYPMRAKAEKGVKEAGDASKGVAGFGGLGSGIAAVATAWMRKELDRTKVIVFDDLERSAITSKAALLGIINYYVEHQQCRVVVIAHDEKMVEELKGTKEKIFGQTLRVEPEVDAAFSAFVGEIVAAQPREFIEQHASQVKLIFSQSQILSLRILRQLVFDLARLFEAIDNGYRTNKNALKELVALFAALNIEIRSERLTQVDLRDRVGNAWKRAVSESSGSDAFEQAQQRYTSVNLDSPILSDEVLVQTLTKGRYDAAAINACLSRSERFNEPAGLPTWLIVYNFGSLDDGVVESAIHRMDEEFISRSSDDLGEFLHVVALRMMLASNQALSKTPSDIESEAICYIDDLLGAGRLASSIEQLDEEFPPRSAKGYGFWVEASYEANFKRVADHLNSQLIAAREQTYPESCRVLVDLMSQDPRQFAEEISFNGRYSRLPVFTAVSEADFVNAWLHAPKKDGGWTWIKRGLERRYQMPALTTELAREGSWIKGVLSELERRASQEAGLVKYRIELVIPKIEFPETT